MFLIEPRVREKKPTRPPLPVRLTDGRAATSTKQPRWTEKDDNLFGDDDDDDDDPIEEDEDDGAPPPARLQPRREPVKNLPDELGAGEDEDDEAAGGGGGAGPSGIGGKAKSKRRERTQDAGGGSKKQKRVRWSAAEEGYLRQVSREAGATFPHLLFV